MQRKARFENEPHMTASAPDSMMHSFVKNDEAPLIPNIFSEHCPFSQAGNASLHRNQDQQLYAG
jgi:hypothetical protein